jgi:hypothetical protein
VVPPLAVGVLSNQRIRRYFAGLLLGYTAWAVAIAAASAPLALGKWTAAAILVIFFIPTSRTSPALENTDLGRPPL